MNHAKKIIDLYRGEETVKTFDKDREKHTHQKYKHNIESSFLKKTINSLRRNSVKVLVVACGTGRMLPEVFSTRKKVKYFGLDTSKTMISILKKKAILMGIKRNVNIILSKATKIPFKNDTFDLVFSYHLLWHLPAEEQKKIIREMIRVCKKEGVVIFDILNKDFIWERVKFFCGGKKTEGIYKTTIGEIRGILGKREVEIEKLSDARINDNFLYGIFNVINLMRKILHTSLFHMVYFKVRK